MENVLRDGKVDTVTDYVSTERYLQHNPEIGDGLVVEHGDVTAPIPDRLPHGNGLF